MEKKLKIKIKTLKWIFMIIPFFPLYCLNLIHEQNLLGSSMAYVTLRILALGRWTITACAMIYFWKKKYSYGLVLRGIVLLAIMRIVAGFMSGRFELGTIIGNITYIGFAFLIEILFNKDKSRLLEANEILFSMIAIVGVFLIYALPNGFNFSTNKENAIYLFGSKNSGFYYYILSVFFITLYNIENKHRYIVKAFILCIMFGLAAILTSSVNTLLCILLLITYFFATYIVHNRLIIGPKFVLLFIVFLGMFVLFGKQVNWINSFLTAFGRDLTFTGRDFIWENFLTEFTKHPIWGVGYDYEIYLRNGAIASHAHNFFVDNLVKYGIIEFFLLILLILTVGKVIAKKQSVILKGFYSLIMFVILLHSLFDDISFYLLILIFICFEKYGCEKFQKTKYR